MANKKYYWLKLKENFFEEDTIAWIEEQPNGILYSNFYLKLCLKSLNTNGLLIRNVGQMLVPYDAKTLSKITNTDIDTVRVAMELFKQIGLIQMMENGEIYLTQLENMVGCESKWAEKKRNQRKKLTNFNENETKFLEGEDIVPQMSQKSPREIEKEKEKDKEIDKEIEKEKREKKKTMDSKESPSSSSSKQVDEFISLYHDVCKSLPKIRVVTDKRKKAIKTLLSKISLEEIKEAFEIIEKTPFLKGDNDRGWKPNIDFLVRHDNIIKILEGFYDSKPQPTNSYQGQRVTINGKEYIMKNGEYYIPKGSGIPVNPYAEDDLPF